MYESLFVGYLLNIFALKDLIEGYVNMPRNPVGMISAVSGAGVRFIVLSNSVKKIESLNHNCVISTSLFRNKTTRRSVCVCVCVCTRGEGGGACAAHARVCGASDRCVLVRWTVKCKHCCS